MMVELKKGEILQLNRVDGGQIDNFSVGINWSAVDKKTWFGMKKVSVDLDVTCILFDEEKKIVDTICFENLKSKDLSIIHSGDDSTGDTQGDDGFDNEIISLDLNKLSQDIHKAVFVLNSFKAQDYTLLGNTSIRFFEASLEKQQHIFAHYQLPKDEKLNQHLSMILGILHRRDEQWEFEILHQSLEEKHLPNIVKKVKENYI